MPQSNEGNCQNENSQQPSANEGEVNIQSTINIMTTPGAGQTLATVTETKDATPSQDPSTTPQQNPQTSGKLNF